MQIVIDIPDTAYQGILNANNASGNWIDDLLGVLCRGVANGTPLPKGHGRLIDADEVKKYYPHDTDWEYPVNTNEYVNETIDNAQTIIEADTESEE